MNLQASGTCFVCEFFDRLLLQCQRDPSIDPTALKPGDECPLNLWPAPDVQQIIPLAAEGYADKRIECFHRGKVAHRCRCGGHWYECLKVGMTVRQSFCVRCDKWEEA